MYSATVSAAVPAAQSVVIAASRFRILPSVLQASGLAPPIGREAFLRS